MGKNEGHPSPTRVARRLESFPTNSRTGGHRAGHLPATLESTPQAVLAPGAGIVHNAPMLSLLMINICFVLYLVIPETT